jgi:spermidine synthase
MRWYFGFFFLSGFCSILYELVWLRLAMAQFAVTTALVSIVLSVFMIGLGLGSWGAGHYIRTRPPNFPLPSLRLYALSEFLIGLSALVFARELGVGRMLLQKLDLGRSFSSPMCYLLAALWIGLTLTPWCACMGATFPFAMSAIRRAFTGESTQSFSYLYLANVLGALTGAVIPLLMIEMWGFKGTLHAGAGLNMLLAGAALMLSLRSPNRTASLIVEQRAVAPPKTSSSMLYCVLFGTGFTSMGVEVVWIRLFTPALGTVVYAFASILGLYLGGTYLGSWFYRRSKDVASAPSGLIFALLGLLVVFPLVICDPRLPIIYHLRVVSILPFSVIVGWLTPMVVDRIAQGDPHRAGEGYAINIAGCVLGPLASGFFLLPFLGERYTLLIFALPWIAVSFGEIRKPLSTPRAGGHTLWKKGLIGMLSLGLVCTTRDFEEQYSPREVRRDSTATVTAAGLGLNKELLVNGVGVTGLTPVTKMIAHLPLAFLEVPPKNALVICFGMGTTHRSVLSWGISSTAVELVPSVVSVFPYFHNDAAQLLRSPLSHVVVDDGRFYLERSTEQFDVIVLDPPPPVQAAASSLLYSKEFYAVAKRHLRPGGVLQQWFPKGPPNDPAILASVAKAFGESFAYVRVFHSVEGWGYHFLGSASPLPPYSAGTLASRLPPTAAVDLIEWGPAATAEQQFAMVLSRELSLADIIHQSPDVPALRDDRPVNEYFVLRCLQDREYRRSTWAHFLARMFEAR